MGSRPQCELRDFIKRLFLKEPLPPHLVMRPLIPLYSLFDSSEIDEFVDACVKNGQVWLAHLCQSEYIPQFISIHRSTINKEKLRVLEYQITTGRWYQQDAQ